METSSVSALKALMEPMSLKVWLKQILLQKLQFKAGRKSVSRYERNLKLMLDWLRVSVAKVQHISVVLPMEPVQFPPKDTRAAGYSQLI